MRPIGIYDSNNEMIFEGDTLEITSKKEMNYNEDFLEKLAIDRIEMKVSERNDQVGVEVLVTFFSNGKIITNQSEYDLMVESHGAEHEYVKEFKESEDMSAPLSRVLCSCNDSLNFHHIFYHREKRIIHSKVTSEYKKANSHYDESNLVVLVNNQRIPANSRFLVELSDSAKERAKEVHAALYETEFGFEGDFSHVELSLESISMYKYQLKANPVNSNGENSWFSINHDWSRYSEYRKKEKKAMTEEFELWLKENANLSEEEHEQERSKRMESLIKKLKKEKTSRDFTEKEPVDDLFMGLSMSQNLFEFFEDQNCKVTVL